MPYHVLINEATFGKAADYLDKLKGNPSLAGKYLRVALQGVDLSRLSVEEFLDHLIRTKRYRVFANLEVDYHPKADWSLVEAGILADIAVTMDVEAYDNGRHRDPQVHPEPLALNLTFIPGPVLGTGNGAMTPDMKECIVAGRIDQESYYQLIERRFLPYFVEVNECAGRKGRDAFMPIPGVGCGEFAGKFKEEIHTRFQHALQELLRQHGDKFPHIKAVYYDSFDKCEPRDEQINGTMFHTVALKHPQSRNPQPQLCHPRDYLDGRYANCDSYLTVAWDGCSMPGNEAHVGRRETDDGVKGLATNAMSVMSGGLAGEYDAESFRYLPTGRNQGKTWEVCFKERNIHLSMASAKVYTYDGQLQTLRDFEAGSGYAVIPSDQPIFVPRVERPVQMPVFSSVQQGVQKPAADEASSKPCLVM
ncbi:hypothetical protein AVI51_01360 [Piscirickettsia salmonis]|uniref:Macrodomain effector MavL domain-containing protein n=1 Tax=Piscirickettsia salmonis TaxID=1238 RepID=A0A9Q5YFY6_PISSA|nr:DUF4804 domain-containing protein [Piscirickettsia salmonis]ALA24704.1 hypothetical protein KW89_1236 [Piscirickettsia salmonis]APS45041.1 hypothetical protein AVI48_12090 [Piscirickettsia salmonis]APS48400.1 hypothetical protein AVI49_12695 [Piscirickettsia salmonis]APS49660.1 hypothetical protein AVI50_01395 [Piscirickettsia salmonis]APS52842.1 hypothetical protein AVI51_01360 [Piscirickettsia salmonis]